MTRVVVAGCMALAALSAAAVFDVGSATAEAAASVSPFAGTYVGADPAGSYPWWTVTISDGGQVTSSFSGTELKGSMSGRIKTDGSYSLTVNVTYWVDRPARWYRTSYKSAGNMASDAVGNIVATDDAYGSFSWLRQ